MYNGWVPSPKKAEPATMPQLLALRDLCLRGGHTSAAAAVDNAIELCSEARRVEEMSTTITVSTTPCRVCGSTERDVYVEEWQCPTCGSIARQAEGWK